MLESYGGSNPDASGKVGATVLGEGGDLQLHPFMHLHQKGNPSTGLIGDNRNATSYKLQQDLEAKMKENDFLAQNLKASEAALKQSQDNFFFPTP